MPRRRFGDTVGGLRLVVPPLAASICLARRRCDVLYAMLKHKIFYRAPTAAAA
ncbi:hypothetical protein G6038_30555 [Rhodococcus sp. 14C212]|uniref:hypothetical protein n=1 Tax=Rhodococcus sp. 14C212 TaxID=2711209 RepID=UPI0013EC7906|nr:hypothetical protein [Rhodococcus sp. 14C212]NGP09724.1 hypothetical protein [Rhodococcus sp. 14C212]